METFTRLGTHNSTHLDAPYHYSSTIAERPAQTMDQLPLDWFFRPGVVLDFHGRGLPDEHARERGAASRES